MIEAPDIPGAADIVAWFGYWPTFHDAEVLSIHLERSGESWVKLHAFEVTREVDSSGYYVRAKHAVVTFFLVGFLVGFPLDQQGIVQTRIEGFNHQNVLFRAFVEKREQHYELVLDGIFGVDCSIVCKQIRVKIDPGCPIENPSCTG